MTDPTPAATRAAIRTKGLPETNEHGLYAPSGATNYATTEPVLFEGELVAEKPAEFLPLNARRALFIAGIAALFVGPLLAVQLPEYGDALVVGGNMLAAVGLGTALANPTR